MKPHGWKMKNVKNLEIKIYLHNEKWRSNSQNWQILVK